MSCLIGIFFQYDASPKVTISGPPLYMVVKISTEHLRQTGRQHLVTSDLEKNFLSTRILQRKIFTMGPAEIRGVENLSIFKVAEEMGRN